MWGEKKTKIVATLSDFRANEEFVRGLFEAGMDVVRINSAHVTEEGAAKIVEAGAGSIRRFRSFWIPKDLKSV